MALDRFVYWGSRKPSRKDLQHIIEDYLGAAASEVKWDNDRFFITLPGKCSFPFLRILTGTPQSSEVRERWIEVYMHKDSVDVMTRQSDEYTNVVAEGLAQLLARFFEGKRDQ